MGEETLAAQVIVHRHQSVDPDHSFSWQWGHLAAKSFAVDEVTKVDADAGVETTVAGQLGGGARRGELAEGIGLALGVAPEPVDLSAIDGSLDGVLPQDAGVEHRILQRGLATEQHGVAIDSLARDAIEALSDV